MTTTLKFKEGSLCYEIIYINHSNNTVDCDNTINTANEKGELKISITHREKSLVWQTTIDHVLIDSTTPSSMVCSYSPKKLFGIFHKHFNRIPSNCSVVLPIGLSDSYYGYCGIDDLSDTVKDTTLILTIITKIDSDDIEFDTKCIPIPQLSIDMETNFNMKLALRDEKIEYLLKTVDELQNENDRYTDITTKFDTLITIVNDLHGNYANLLDKLEQKYDNLLDQLESSMCIAINDVNLNNKEILKTYDRHVDGINMEFVVFHDRIKAIKQYNDENSKYLKKLDERIEAAEINILSKFI